MYKLRNRMLIFNKKGIKNKRSLKKKKVKSILILSNGKHEKKKCKKVKFNNVVTDDYNNFYKLRD